MYLSNLFNPIKEHMMPRANRYFRFFPAGYPWHITHRCHNRDFLLNISYDRARWRDWLRTAKERFGLRVLNYCVTCNHIHLLVLGTDDPYRISKSMQLIAGSTAEGYNFRKGRRGAFWEDRYHATVVETGNYFLRCMDYIDLNMVRAGVVKDPGDWVHCGYRELTMKRVRNPLIDREVLSELLGVADTSAIRAHRQQSITTNLGSGPSKCDKRWSTSIAVGGKTFVSTIDNILKKASKAHFSNAMQQSADQLVVREPSVWYGTDRGDQMCCLGGSNLVPWDVTA
ncbi:MAG: transposase [Chitinivibrionales bacterium]|nr:transposase [Chitinivibrionales bacterium]